MIKVDNVIILGLAVPEQIRDGRKTVCVAAYHDDLGLIRLYPCRADMGLRRWGKISVTIERAEHDTRSESWKLVGSHDQWESLSIVNNGVILRSDRIVLLEKLAGKPGECVREINSLRYSLGVIKPLAIHSITFEENPTHKKPLQTGLSLKECDAWVSTKADYSHQLRIKYQCCKNCRGHDQTLLEWGAFEWMRKNPGEEIKLFNNWRLHDEHYQHYLVVGNQCQHRNSFLVINIIPLKVEKAKQPTLQQIDLTFETDKVYNYANTTR